MTGFIIENSTIKIGRYINVSNLLQQMTKVCLEEFIKQPSFKQINWRAEALKDHKTNGC